jgi:hypothetical protein
MDRLHQALGFRLRATIADIPGHVEFLGPAFVAALKPDNVEPDGSMIVDRFQVAPLTIMTIEDLEAAGARPSLHDFMASVQDRYRFMHSREVASIAHEQLRR